jgi:hypothetical protein
LIYGSTLLLQQQGNIPDASDREMLANILSAVSSIRKLLSNLHNGQWQHAEALLQKLPHDPRTTATTQAIVNILHELRLYQSELEAQNTQLRSNDQRRTHDIYDAVNQSLFSARIISETLLDTASISPNGHLSHLQHLNAAIGRAIAEMQILRFELDSERLLATPPETLLRQLIYSCDHANVTIECTDGCALR